MNINTAKNTYLYCTALSVNQDGKIIFSDIRYGTEAEVEKAKKQFEQMEKESEAIQAKNLANRQADVVEQAQNIYTAAVKQGVNFHHLENMQAAWMFNPSGGIAVGDLLERNLDGKDQISSQANPSSDQGSVDEDNGDELPL